MTMLQQKSEQLGNNLKMAGYGIDPLTILAIITALIQIFKGCGLSPSQSVRRAASPKLLDRLVVRRQIRKHAPGQDEEAILAAILDAGRELTTAEVKALYAEAPDLPPQPDDFSTSVTEERQVPPTDDGLSSSQE